MAFLVYFPIPTNLQKMLHSTRKLKNMVAIAEQAN